VGPEALLVLRLDSTSVSIAIRFSVLLLFRIVRLGWWDGSAMLTRSLR